MHKNAIYKIFMICSLFFLNTLIANAQQNLSNRIISMVQALTQKMPGNVIESKDGQIYISLGTNHGVTPGNLFEVIELGEVLEFEGQQLGHVETNIGTIEVKTVRDKLSIASIREGAKEIMKGQVVYKKSQNYSRFVVAQFDNGGQNNQFTRIVQDNTIDALVNSGFSVVEREQLEQVLEEQKLGYSGLLNLESAQKIGELLGAEAIIVGTVNDTTNNVNVNARLVSISTGEAAASNVFSLAKTPEIETMLQTNTVGAITKSVSGKKSSRQNKSKSKSTVNNIEFEFKECIQGGSKLECSVFMTNLDSDKFVSIYFNNSSYGIPSSLTDIDGNTYNAKIAKFNGCTQTDYKSVCAAKLISQTKTKIFLVFEIQEKLEDPIQLINLELRDRDENKNFTAQLRTLPLN